jgi:Cu+-exporting ATPase
MKKIIIFSTIVTYFLVSACGSNKNEQPADNNTSQTFNLDTTKLKSGGEFYQCEMDPEIISDKPGDCPKCGMELEKKEKK